MGLGTKGRCIDFSHAYSDKVLGHYENHEMWVIR